MPFHKTILVFSRNNVLHLMMGCVQVMFSIPTSNMVSQLIFLYILLCFLCCCSWRGNQGCEVFGSCGEVGSDFIPLVAKCFGVWTPFALKTLSVIAHYTTPHNAKLARKNLLQQLSVALWLNNVRMILYYWAQGIDIDLFP